MRRKGFPESYDLVRLLSSLSDVEAGNGQIDAPIYFHLAYDIELGKQQVIRRPDIRSLPRRMPPPRWKK